RIRKGRTRPSTDGTRSRCASAQTRIRARSQAVHGIRDVAWRSGRLQRADVGDAPSGTAAWKIHDGNVVQGNVAHELLRAEVQLPIFGGGPTHAAMCNGITWRGWARGRA